MTLASALMRLLLMPQKCEGPPLAGTALPLSAEADRDFSRGGSPRRRQCL